ncbi:MAG: UbiA family prenyltransferase [Saprospiraceae bacterium]|nr:UbiA family prenyltransferase [Saprospiraceae bacterium]
MKSLFSIFKKIEDWNLVTAFCVTTFYWFQVLSFEKTVSAYYSLVLFCGTLIVYNLHGNVSSEILKKDTVRTFLVSCAILGAGAGFSGLDIFWFLALLPAVVISVLYIFPLFPGGKRLRDFGLFKIFLLSGTMVYVTVFLPLFAAQIHPAVLLKVVFSRFLFIFLIGLLFDIRDKEVDMANGWKSIPIVLGEVNTRRLSVFILTVIGLTDFYMVYQFIIPIPVFLALVISQFFLFLLIFNAFTLKNKSYYSFLADFLLVIPFLVLILLT